MVNGKNTIKKSVAEWKKGHYYHSEFRVYISSYWIWGQLWLVQPTEYGENDRSKFLTQRISELSNIIIVFCHLVWSGVLYSKDNWKSKYDFYNKNKQLLFLLCIALWNHIHSPTKKSRYENTCIRKYISFF